MAFEGIRHAWYSPALDQIIQEEAQQSGVGKAVELNNLLNQAGTTCKVTLGW